MPEPRSTIDIPAAYEHCRLVTKRSGSTFAAAFWMLPKPKRRALHALYAFCRLADDIADDPDVAGNRSMLLERWREELANAYLGTSKHPVGIALGDAARRYALPQEILLDLLRGVESDLNAKRMETFDDLRRYCYRVASTVGLLIVRVLGYRNERTLEYAEAMGIAVQLTNVLRDIGEDAASGRVYLPFDDIDRFGVSVDDLAGPTMSDELRLLLAFYAERARLYYEKAADLLPPEDRQTLLPAEAMGRMYRSLLDELQRRRFPCLQESVRLSNARRLSIAVGVWSGVSGRAASRFQ